MSKEIKVLQHKYLQKEINPTGWCSSGGQGINVDLTLVAWKDVSAKVQRYQLRLCTHTRLHDECGDLYKDEFSTEFAPCYERGVWNPNYKAILGQIPVEKWYKLYEEIRREFDFRHVNAFFERSQQVANLELLLHRLDDLMWGLWRK